MFWEFYRLIGYGYGIPFVCLLLFCFSKSSMRWKGRIQGFGYIDTQHVYLTLTLHKGRFCCEVGRNWGL